MTICKSIVLCFIVEGYGDTVMLYRYVTEAGYRYMYECCSSTGCVAYLYSDSVSHQSVYTSTRYCTGILLVSYSVLYGVLYQITGSWRVGDLATL